MEFNNCFIGGTGRCGTSILKRILDKHSDVETSRNEMRILFDPDGFIDFYISQSSFWSQQNYDIKLYRLKDLLYNIGQKKMIYKKLISKFLQYSGIAQYSGIKFTDRYEDFKIVEKCPEYFDIVDNLISQLIDFKFTGSWTAHKIYRKNEIFFLSKFNNRIIRKYLREFYINIIQCITKSNNFKCFVDDTPQSFVSFDKLLFILPNSKLIHIYRDPRDVVASLIKAKWAPSNVFKAIEFYKSSIDLWFIVKRKVPKNKIIEIKFEDLIYNSEYTLKNISKYLNIKWDNNLLNVNLNLHNIGRWKNDFDNNIHSEINILLEPYLNNFGYNINI